MNIFIKYLPNAHPIEQTNLGSWIDLYTYEDVYIKQDEFQLINLGIAMELPIGYEAILAPRSSTYKNWGLIQANSIGVIDSSYCGDDDIWKFPAIELKGDTFIPAGTRICQFKIQQEQPRIHFLKVDNLRNDNRGGFGSTGL